MIRRDVIIKFGLFFMFLGCVCSLIFFLACFYPSYASGEDSSVEEQVKEFPHDLYQKGENTGDKDEKKIEKEGKGDVKIEININVDKEKKERDKSVESKDGDKSKKEFPDPPKDISKNADDFWYYLDRWINNDYKAMYGALTEDTKKKYTFKKFFELYQREFNVNGGLESAKFLGELKKRGPYYEGKVELTYVNENIQPTKVMAVLQSTMDGYRVKDCGLIPVDYNNL